MLIHDHAKDGDVAGVARELDQGVGVDIRDRDSRQTPLMDAVASPRAGLDIVRLLIERGADVNAVGGHERRSAVSLAISAGHPEKVAALLDAGADIRYQRSGPYDAL